MDRNTREDVKLDLHPRNVNTGGFLRLCVSVIKTGLELPKENPEIRFWAWLTVTRLYMACFRTHTTAFLSSKILALFLIPPFIHI
jgi:hypothetical protein